MEEDEEIPRTGPSYSEAQEEKELFQSIIDAYNHTSEILLTGSLAELPLKYYLKRITDVDIMIVPSDLVAVEEFDSIEGSNKEQLYIEATEPGYVRLVSRDEIIYNSLLDFRGERDVVEGSSAKRNFINFSSIQKSHPDIFDFVLKHIPDIGNFSLDRVIAMKCQKWPTVATEWIKRERLHDWPSKSTMDEIVSQGCHFVAKPEMDRQWRYSFSRAELTLILTWSSSQKYIYYILRLILKEVKNEFKAELENRAKKTVLCSYSLKTLMLWMCENESFDFWLKDNFEYAINSILEKFVESLKEVKCQNYFIQNYNNWSQSPVDVGFEKEIEYLKLIRINNLVKELMENNPFDEPASFSIASLDSRTHQMWFNMCGFVSILNVTELNEILPFAKYSELSNLKHLCKGLCLQNQLASPLVCNSVPPSTKEIEDNLNTAFHSTFHDYTNQRIFPDSALDMSLFEILVAAFKYFATDDFAVRLNKIQRNDIKQAKMTIPGFMEHFMSSFIFSKSRMITNLFEIIADVICRYIPHVFYCLVAAHRANFYYVTVKDYKLANDICDEALKRIEEFLKLYDQFYHPVLWSNRLSGIYDDVIQSIIGFFTLLKWQLKRMNGSWCRGDVQDIIVLRVPAHVLLYYIQDRLPVDGQTSPRKFEIAQLEKLLHTIGERFYDRYMGIANPEHFERRNYTERESVI